MLVTDSEEVSNKAKLLRSWGRSSSLFSESEAIENRFNEYIMTGLRTIWGISLQKVETEFGVNIKEQLLQNSKKLRASNFLVIEANHLKITATGKFLADGIASDLFLV